ncbi:Zn(2)-C6 fungal-type DNA-binding domain protein [Metarhizium album ARSEF 1941]|uniref:Zn(2)-C6 fungal-type DNA-binding domain protein n=1 Tax=Metarhizium album (strain ARSEF 1941) TaxID=1081103 RepID=A0A0B2X7V9_METAS|nr:Zn(2)-C6 fungal-type DNA-binding domain protein [Metarhizium album ARSEF 1941]KHO01833.1 Zn(2)-C6 fungal-type DNA-binding domain protein [Metarhizium album ARSEF 1941]
MSQSLGTSPHRQQLKPHRRSHRKSRNGCVECKRRHIRCDERRPACANCTIAERACVFPPPVEDRPSKTKSSSSSPLHLHSPRGQSPSHPPTYTLADHQRRSTTAWDSSRAPTPRTQSPPTTSEPSPSPLPSFGESFPQPYDSPSPDAPLFTADHLSLLYHITLTKDSFLMAPDQGTDVVEIAIRLASSHPYLIDEVLALAALHKATTASPSDSAHLLHVATQLQTRAIRRFTRLSSTLPPEDMASSIPRFLFAATLSLHDLADTLSSVRTLHHSQFPVFVNRFVDCFRIHHGVRAVIRPTWQHLLTSELEPLLRVTERTGTETDYEPAVGKDSSRGHECRPLHDLLASSDLGPATVTACRGAVDRLQWAFDLYRDLSTPAAGPHATSAFSVTVGTDYVDVLRRLQPEAVAVLAYYGVLLHQCRHFWIFGNAGAFVVRAIARNLGTYWHQVMAWPLSMIEEAADERADAPTQ